MTGPEEVVNESGLVDSILSPNAYALTILLAMNRMGKHIYEGTVVPKEVTKRRKANKKARAQRKVNRHN
jgi:hypothetical protein